MISTLLPKIPRLLLGFLLVSVLGLSGAQGQSAPGELRIGLRTQQREVRLQATVPVRITRAREEVLAFPADAILIFRAANGGVTLVDADGAERLAATGPVQVLPAAPTVEGPLPLIRVLGPSRHYDGKPDRSYRGFMEILPRAEGLTVVNVVEVEPYLLGVVPSEMSPRYPVESLKAQAVAARTYALKNIGRRAQLGFDLDDTAASQVYGGYTSEDERTSRAVRDTAGVVATYNGQLIDAVYSSTCGGFTESAEMAWGRAVPYLVSVSDYHRDVLPEATYPQDEAGWATYFKVMRAFNCLQPRFARPEAFRWVKLMTRAEVEAALPPEHRVGTVRALTPLRRGHSGRITALRVEGSERSVVIEKELPIRRALGNLRSSAFVVDTYPDDAGAAVVFAFWGAGWGHGLGMCQVGAVGLADGGWTYDAILTHYYRGISLQRR